MATTHIDAFAIDGVKVVLNDDTYTEKRGFAEYTKETEAGTTRRDVIRIGYLAELSVKIKTTGTVKATLEDAAAQDSVELTIWSDGDNSSTTWTCFVSSFTADLIRDTSTATYWDVSVTFKDLEAS